MAQKQNLVEEALIQMRSLENVVSENAKGILASTMKGEISELVKESLETEDDSEFDSYVNNELDEQDELDTETDDEDEDDNELPMGDEFDDEEDSLEDKDEFEFPTMDDEDEEPIDLTNASDAEILKVFKAMGDQDGIIIKKDGDMINLEDTGADVEYKIQMGESKHRRYKYMKEEDEEDFMYDDVKEEDEEDFMYDDVKEEDEEDFMYDNVKEEDEEDFMYDNVKEEDEMDMDMDPKDEIMFEIEMDDFEEIGNESKFSNDDEENFSFDFTNEDEDEDAEFQKMETTEGFKAKGVGMGKAKFSYNKPTGGFKEKMKHANPTKGTGKPKFEFKEGDDMTGMKKPMMKKPMMNKPMMKKPMMVKGGETTEASRTLGNGKRWGRNGLDKPRAAPQHLRVEGLENELVTLRERNEEYRKALNIFRSKLNEVAVFNSNLAYATRLFTEHSTTKNEKINILRRFDSVESLKESKSLYKTVKDELGNQGGSTVVKESFQHKIEKTPASGSAINLMESKTYENPQFMRMKDLMTKMNVVK
jgi:hypothetical protein